MIEVDIQTDFVSGTMIVKAYERWKSGSITMMEHIVHPPNKDQAEKIKVMMELTLAGFTGRMIAAGEVPIDGKARLKFGDNVDVSMFYGSKGW